MLEMIIWLVVMVVLGISSMAKNGTLTQLFGEMSKKKQNQDDNVVFEQDENGVPKRKQHTSAPIHINFGAAGKGVAIVLVLVFVANCADRKYEETRK